MELLYGSLFLYSTSLGYIGYIKLSVVKGKVDIIPVLK